MFRRRTPKTVCVFRERLCFSSAKAIAHSSAYIHKHCDIIRPCVWRESSEPFAFSSAEVKEWKVNGQLLLPFPSVPRICSHFPPVSVFLACFLFLMRQPRAPSVFVLFFYSAAPPSCISAARLLLAPLGTAGQDKHSCIQD